MNTQTKNHIDAARQVLVGVVPNPTSQIDQITNALIYKFMDDMDQSAIKQGGDPSFFVGNLEQYAWTRLMDARIGNQERMNIYSEALVKFSESKQLPQLFREIFKSAFLPYRSPEVLGLFLKEIDYFDYSHPEELGNAYEYLLSIMSSQGDAGQFRTPRHIIDFMVEVVDPTMEDKVLDPACGTGGFLVSTYKHILKQHIEKPLTPDQRKNLMGNFEGYDIDPGMVRIAQVNMYLHQFKNPKIFNNDTLSMDERWSDKFSVILANPPFMSPKGGVSTHSKFSIESTRSEVLFVDYIMNHLRPQGRAAVIVPEGIIFQSGTAHKQLRKNLVEDGLYAVVSLPSGVFQPYSGVKTSILLFNNELAKHSKEILFVKIENDGFDLGATKRSISKNDLPDALDVLNDWKKGKKVENDKAVYIEKTKIAESGDYNLSGDRYRVVTDYSEAKWPMVELGEVCELLNGYAFKSENYVDSGVRVVRITNVQKGEIIDDNPKFYPSDTKEPIEKYKLLEGDLLVSLTGNVGRVGLLGRELLPAALNQRVACLRVNNEKISQRFLFSFLNGDDFENDCVNASSGVAQKNLSTVWLSKFKIPLPPLEIQKQIVEELDGYQGIITGAKQIINSWKSVIAVDPKWEKVTIGSLCELYNGKAFKPSDWKKKESGGLPIIRIQNLNNAKAEYNYFTGKTDNQVIVNNGDLLFSWSGSRGTSFGPHIWNGEKAILNQHIFRVVHKSNILKEFFYLMLKDAVKEVEENLHGGVGLVHITKGNLERIEVPLPPLEIQKKIVERIQAEQILVEGNKKLIEIYEQKTRDALSKLWEE